MKRYPLLLRQRQTQAKYHLVQQRIGGNVFGRIWNWILNQKLIYFVSCVLAVLINSEF